MITTILARYITVAVQFIIIFLTLDFYGVDARGVVAALVAIAGLIGAISSLTIGKGLMSIVERYKNNKETLPTIYITAIFGVLILGCLSYCVHLSIFYFYPSIYGELELLHLSLFSLAAFYYIWVQVGPYIFSLVGCMKIYNFLSLTANSAVVLALVSVYLLDAGFEVFLQVLASMYFLEFFVGFLFVIKIIGWAAPSFEVALLLVKSGILLHIDTLGGVMFTSFSVVLVNMMMGLEAVAEYDLISRIFALLCLLPQAIQMFQHKDVIFSKTTDLLKKQMRLFRGICLIYFLVFPISVLAWRPITTYLDFSEGSIFVYLILGAAFLPYTYSSIVSPYWIKNGKSLSLSVFTLLVGLSGLCISVLLISRIGILGAAVGVFVSYCLSAIVNFKFYRSIKYAS
ncbi:hypothetical protein ACVBEJ_03125 [Porticoccus sp. GXU_MW_L64]